MAASASKLSSSLANENGVLFFSVEVTCMSRFEKTLEKDVKCGVNGIARAMGQLRPTVDGPAAACLTSPHGVLLFCRCLHHHPLPMNLGNSMMLR